VLKTVLLFIYNLTNDCTIISNPVITNDVLLVSLHTYTINGKQKLKMF
jgi:hypothetical protein